MKVSNSKGTASQTGSESCVAHSEMRDEMSAGGNPQGADAVHVEEGSLQFAPFEDKGLSHLPSRGKVRVS